MTPAELADELEALAKNATAAPWDQDRGVEKREPNACAIITAPDGSTLFDTINGGNVLLDDPDHDGNWRDETGDLNAALIVGLRNRLPAILSSLRRVEKLEAALRCIQITDTGLIITAGGVGLYGWPTPTDSQIGPVVSRAFADQARQALTGEA